ncbi:hypothetical protein KV097_04790 [Mumia sp. zg.B17]|uniref:hypothetical protein n=1 Tax=Mumia sp. zg.B17 TaxID=2855446 RepID=UPI001C6EBE4E|nr:hypothetical protein [Mumia sp. zg.B17]MBW9205252.1 hypothetical protein [Mumia sp. zg.B17]
MAVRHVGLVGTLTSPGARRALLRRGTRSTIPEVLDTAPLQAREVEVPGQAAAYGFTWEHPDADTEDWYPQGVTTSADATAGDAPGGTGGRDVVAVSWYAHHHARRNGARLTFVDLATLRYQHVLLVRARRTPWGVRARPVPTHAGGIAWYGPYLYVAATRAGIYVVRIDDLLRLPDGARGGPSRRLGYELVLPVFAKLSAWSRDDGSRLRYSFLSIQHGSPEDGSPASLVVGEYGGVGKTQRLWRFRLDPRTHLPVRDPATGRLTPDELHPEQAARMQGATAIDGTWYVTTSQGRGNNGDLLVGRPGAFRRHKKVLPTGCEDIAAWPQQRRLWSVTEWPGMRWVYAVDADAWEGP